MFDTASTILIVAGMLNLLVGALSGIPMALERQAGATAVPKYLTMLHMAGLMHGPILISVGVALSMSTLTPWIDTAGAATLAFASLLLLLKDTLNWRQGILDEFAEESLGLRIGQLFGPLEVVGLLIATAGVLSGI